MRYIALLPLCLLGACTATADTSAARSSAAERDRIELAEELRGRVAGQPQSCVQLRNLRGNHSAGDAIIFEGNGGLIYVNRPAGGCPDLNSGRALQTRAFSTQLCRGDIATVYDPVSNIFYGSCGLGDFVPYRMASR
jgi:hypothetical protein